MTSAPATRTVRDATRDLMRGLGLTTVFGNPGSTEEPFLQDWPADFTYVLSLHEGSAVSMADGWSRVMRRPALVNLHTAAGVGNAMGNLAALCQRCHLAHDRPEHRRQRWTTLFRRRALGDLFLGLYR